MYSIMFIIFFVIFQKTDCISQHPLLLIVSYDAFRYDYLDKFNLPNMVRLRDMGTQTSHMINVFPTKTFPNHHTMVTGVYPNVHGVISNNFFDHILKKCINISEVDLMFGTNKEIVPIWKLNEDAGGGRYSGVMMWPGACAKYQNKLPTHLRKYERKIDFYARVDEAFSWFVDTKRPANLVLLYFEEPDYHSHPYGPNSPVVKEIIESMDNLTLYIEQKAQKLHLTNKLNIIHLSDHGMIGVKFKNLINITQYLVPGSYILTGTTPVLYLEPLHDNGEDMYEILKQISRRSHFTIYKKEELPDRWHFDHPRSPPYFLISDVGYGFEDIYKSMYHWEKRCRFSVSPDWEFGTHGYDYLEEKMQPFFMARGPRIKPHNVVDPVKSINLFELFCAILEINPKPNNGSYNEIKDILVPQYYWKKVNVMTRTVLPIAGAFILIGIGIFIIVMLRRPQKLTNSNGNTVLPLDERFAQTSFSVEEAQSLLEPEEA